MMETDRFLLRPWRESDAEALFKYEMSDRAPVGNRTRA